MTTLGDRPRWRCEDCHHECYPHDEVLCFLEHRVSWPLATVGSRLAAQLGSFEEARDKLKEDCAVLLAKETVRDVAEAAGQRILYQEDELRQRIQERQAPLPESEQNACFWLPMELTAQRAGCPTYPWGAPLTGRVRKSGAGVAPGFF